jgi:hypothetical protein
VNGLYQKLAVINRVGMGDGVEDGIDAPNTGAGMEATDSLFTDRFNALSEPTLVMSIIFILTAGSRQGGAGVVDSLDGSSSRAHGQILRGVVKYDERGCNGEKRTNAERMRVVIVGIPVDDDDNDNDNEKGGGEMRVVDSKVRGAIYVWLSA